MHTLSVHQIEARPGEGVDAFIGLKFSGTIPEVNYAWKISK